MPENSEKNPLLSKRAKIIGSVALAATAALSYVGIENRNKAPHTITQEAAQSIAAKQENNTDKILSPEETDAKIQEFITKIDSVYAEVQVERPTEFPDTTIIRTNEPNRLSDDKIPAEFETAIAPEDYLTAESIKKLAQNCNATYKDIEVRGVTITEDDDFFIRHAKENCAGVAFGIGLLAKQTGSTKANELLAEWQPIHHGIIKSYTTVEPPTSPQQEIDEIDQKFYQVLQK